MRQNPSLSKNQSNRFQVRSQGGLAQAWSKKRPSSTQAWTQHVNQSGNTAKDENTPTFPDTLPLHTLSLCLSLDDCINTGKAHSTDAYTLTVQHQFTVTPLNLSLTHSHTSTVLCGQAGG